MSLLFDQDEIMRIHDVNLAAEVTESVTKSVTESVTKKERENGIRALVRSYKKFGGDIVDAIKSAMTDFGISEQEAGALIRKYW